MRRHQGSFGLLEWGARLGTLCVVVATAMGAASAHAAGPGPDVGTRVPSFSAIDQSGVTRTFESLRGPEGLVLVFFRSADW